MTGIVQLGAGITLGAGVGVGVYGPIPGFTISPADFTQQYYGYQITPDGSNGFTNNGISGPGENFYAPCLGSQNGAPSPAKLNEIIAYFEANGLNTTNNNSYIFDVIWGPGSAPQSNKVVLSLYSEPNYAVLNIGTVSTATSAWQTGGQNIYNNGVLFSAQGTYNFPATFTLYQPLITNSSSWC